MPDLHEWISQQIDKVADAARDATEGPWYAEHPEGRWGDDPEARLIGGGKTLATFSNDYNGHLNADHAALNSPATVLRRCAADRKILAEHKPMEYTWSSWYACEGCGYDGADYCTEPMTSHVNDCPTLLALAEGYGLTEEQRAALDRPKKERPAPNGPSLLSNEVVDAYSKALTEMVLSTRPVEPRLTVKLVGPRIPMPEWLREDLGLPAPAPEPTPEQRAFAVVEPHLNAITLYKPDTRPEA